MERHDKIREAALAPVGSALLSPDMRVVERDGWYQTIKPSSRSTVGNEVVLSRVPLDEADAVIDRTIAEYRALGLPFKWCINPLTEPADFGSRLEARGFEWWPIRGMAIEPRTWTARPRSGITVEPVTAFDEYLVCWQAGWEVSVEDRAGWIADHERALATGRFHFFLARVDGEPAGTAGYITRPHAVYLVGGNVLPKFRGRGVYRALLDARLVRAADAGFALATTQAREATSAPILEALGFETLYRARIYKWSP